MLAIYIVSATLVISCVIFHGLALQFISRFLFRAKVFSFSRISLLIFLVILAHLVEITFFEIAYSQLVPSDNHGSIAGVENPDWRDLFYFSAMTYTATGYGDLVPVGNLRLLATIEALTGLIMIAWTASFAFLMMQQYWKSKHITLDNPKGD